MLELQLAVPVAARRVGRVAVGRLRDPGCLDQHLAPPTGRMVSGAAGGQSGSGQGVVGGTGVPLSANAVVPAAVPIDGDAVDVVEVALLDVAEGSLVALALVVVVVVLAVVVVAVVVVGSASVAEAVAVAVVDVLLLVAVDVVARGVEVRGGRTPMTGVEGTYGMFPGPMVRIRASTVAR